MSFSVTGRPSARAHRFSGGELRRLNELRELIKIESVHLSQALLRDLLALLEGARPWQTPPPAIPEMTRGEMLRAIRWRLGTIPPAGAEAAAAFVTGHRRRTGTRSAASPRRAR
jgi:hypothetical protein